MKRLLLTLLLGATISCAQSPQVPLTGNIGAGGIFPLINSPGVSFVSDANHTMTYPEMSGSSGVLIVTSTVSLTATRQLVVPLGKFTWQVKNSTTGGQSITVGASTGSAVTIANGATATVVGDGTNYTSPSGGGSPVTWPASGSLVVSNGTNSPAGLAEVDTDCAIGVSGAWVTGPCGTSSPLMTKGDLYGYSTTNARVAIGADHFVLTADSTQALGLAWEQLPTCATGTLGLCAPDNSTIKATSGTLTAQSTTINGQTCTPGSTCTVTAAATTSQYIQAAQSNGGVAFATGLAVYDNNAPQLGSYNTAASTAAYLAFQFAAASPQYAQGATVLPAFWTGTDITIDFTSTATSGNVIWEVETACPAAAGSTPGTPTFGTAMTVTTAVPGTAGQQATASITGIAANSVNGCPATGATSPSQLIYRIFRSASDTASGDAQANGIVLITHRSQ